MKPRSKGPLAGLIVVDLTRVLAGPYCTMMLADLGARVIKVEMPGVGDDARHIGPFISNSDSSPSSGYFFSVNRNKESIALSLKDDADRGIFESLLLGADVLVENFTPGTMDRFGWSWKTLSSRFPRLILASISGFGQTGPYRELPAYDMVVQAMGGVMSLTGEEGGSPTRVGVSIGDIAAGTHAVIGIQAAVIERSRTGQGKHVDISMLDAQVCLLENALVRYQIDQTVPGPIGARHPSITPFGIFKTNGGHIIIAAGNDRKFKELCDALQMQEAKTDRRFLTNASRCEYHRALVEKIDAALADKTTGEWLSILTQAGIPCGPMNDVAAVMRDPQLNARGMFVPLEAPGGTVLKTAACPIRFADDQFASYRPAPELDADREALLQELGIV
ncbi:CoA transferase [Bradyrhizobium sp. CCBAU 53340]|nr:CoA transferase [Bradyrhizobium sp. CCBAU 53340]